MRLLCLAQDEACVGHALCLVMHNVMQVML